jgi:hypothetical protein
MAFLGAGLPVANAVAVLSLRDRLWIDTILVSERSYALSTMLNRSTDCLRCRGAPMKNLAHSASFHSMVNFVPSNAETEHLELN